jgi:hypothetical protein
MRSVPCAVECRGDGKAVYACIGDRSDAMTEQIRSVIGFGDTLPDALRALADEIEKEVGVDPLKHPHPLKFVKQEGMLAEALGLPLADTEKVEKLVHDCIAKNNSMRELFEAVGALEISDELWANFLYTFGWWDGRRRL